MCATKKGAAQRAGRACRLTTVCPCWQCSWTRISLGYRVPPWKRTLPSQTLLSSQFTLLVQSITTPPDKPQHHVVFSPGYKDRIKFTKSKSRGHPSRYWFELVSSEATRYLNHHIDHTARPRPEGYRRDFLGLKQHLSLDPTFGDRLTTAPTRAPSLFPLCQKTVGCAWQT